MQGLRTVLRVLVTLPWDLPAGLVAGLVGLLWGHAWQYEAATTPHLSFELRPDSWFWRGPYRGWGGTTLGRVVWYAPGRRADTRLGRHEQEHLRQHEAASLSGLLLGGLLLALGAPWWAAGVAWLGGYPLMALGAWGAAWGLHGGRPYRDAVHERAARAVAVAGDPA